MKSHFSFRGSHIQKLRSSVSSASESMSDTIKSSVPHPGQHLFFLRAKSHLQCGQVYRCGRYLKGILPKYVAYAQALAATTWAFRAMLFPPTCTMR
jgi:hypothetical protein